MKPAWDKLMAEYVNHSSILVADVDCTTAGKSLCDEVGVKGFPTIKYGDPTSLEDYEGGRDYAALAKFAKANLGPRCSPVNLDLCEADNKAKIESFMAMPMKELDGKISDGEDKMKASDKALQDSMKALQAKYTKAQEEAKEKKESLKKNSNLGLMKSVLAHRKTG